MVRELGGGREGGEGERAGGVERCSEEGLRGGHREGESQADAIQGRRR